jgi:hypothetical protein
MRKLKEVDCRACMEAGEFSADIVGAAESVAVVLTQSWCPQWTRMRAYLESAVEGPGFVAFWVEYDREAFFGPFMRFKEESFGNREVPYVRYYRGGSLVAQSNFVDRDRFLSLLGPSTQP